MSPDDEELVVVWCEEPEPQPSPDQELAHIFAALDGPQARADVAERQAGAGADEDKAYRSLAVGGAIVLAQFATLALVVIALAGGF